MRPRLLGRTTIDARMRPVRSRLVPPSSGRAGGRPALIEITLSSVDRTVCTSASGESAGTERTALMDGHYIHRHSSHRLSRLLPAQNQPHSLIFTTTDSLPASGLTDWTDFITGPFLLSISVFAHHRRRVAKRGGSFQRRLFVCLSVCLSA